MAGLICVEQNWYVDFGEISVESSKHIDKMVRSSKTLAAIIGYTSLSIQIIIMAFYNSFRGKTLHKTKHINNAQLTCKSINSFTSLIIIITSIVFNFVPYQSR